MTKEKLMEWGLTEEQANKVMGGLNGSFVTKSRFNEVNTELQTAKKTIGERDQQLEALKKSTGDTEALQTQITQLQADNAQQKKAHEAEIKALKISNAIDVALTNAKAKNNTAVKALLATFLEKAELADDGTVKGLDDEIGKLTKGEDTAFLFDTSGKAKFKGAKAAEKSDPHNQPTGDDLSKMSYDELCKYMEENPDAVLE
jgi:myosin heavy subunit|nr:MAG TPA: minor structural protein [Caudoviricetes sp.]